MSPTLPSVSTNLLTYPSKPRHPSPPASSFKKALWTTLFLTLNLLILCIPLTLLLIIHTGDFLSIAKRCASHTSGFSKTSCESTADFVTDFFGALFMLCMILVALGVLVVLRRSFEGVWGHCGWKGNRMGCWLRRFWVLGEGGWGTGNGSGNGGLRERRVLNVLGSRAVMGEVDEEEGACARCDEGYGTF